VTSEISIQKVWSSSVHKEDKADNAIDGNEETKFSAKGKGEYIVLDLGVVHEVSALKIKWYEGFMRKMTYELFYSNSKEDKSFRRIGACVSSGSLANEYEENTFERPIKCQFLKIVGHGNDLNSFISIVDIKVLGVDRDGQADEKTVPDMKVGESTAPAEKVDIDPKAKRVNK
jgi:hypothetical protein